MKNTTLNFEEFSMNEFLNLFNKKFQEDDLAKKTFKKMLDSIEDLKVMVFSDYKREVSFVPKSGDKPESEGPNKPESEEGPNKPGPEEGPNKPEDANKPDKQPDDPNKPSKTDVTPVQDEKSAYPLMIKNLTALRDLLSQYKNISIEGQESSGDKKITTPTNLEDLKPSELIKIEPKVELDKEEIEDVKNITVDIKKDAEKTFDELYKEIFDKWKSGRKEGQNTSPGEGTRDRFSKEAKYKLLVIEWQKSQKEAGKSNMNPGLGTRNRLMRIAKEWFESTKAGKYEIGKIYTYTNQKGEKKKVKLLSITHDTSIGPDKEWLTKDDSKKEKLAKGTASILFKDKNGEYTSKSPEMAVKLSNLSESVISFSDFIFEANSFGKISKATIKKNETDLIKAFTKIKKSISVIIDEKDKGVSITSQFCDDVLAEKMKSKEIIVALYKEIWEHLYGKYKSTMPKFDNLYKENINIVKDKKKIVAEKIARFSLRSIQFDKEGLYGGLATFGDSLEVFNETLKQIMGYFNSKVEKVTEEVEIRGFKGSRQTKKFIGTRIKTGGDSYYKTTGKTSITVNKTSSKHRLSSKIWGAGSENSFSLAINGKTYVGNIKGKEGEPLINPKISQMYYDFLTELGYIQDKLKRNNMDESEYQSERNKIKSKYQAQLAKFK